MRLAIHINDYTDEEINSCYYRGEDFRAFKLDVKRAIRMLGTKRTIDENKICTRGVECRTKESAAMRFRIRGAAQSAVLREQRKQTGNGSTTLAAVYSPIAGTSVVSAYMMGLSDAAVAKELAASDEEEEPRRREKTLDAGGVHTSIAAFKLLRIRKLKEETHETAALPKQIFNSA
eukprot:CAMPEP_0117051886 /NCGR_PEP_ID=MMETSP0472-20121206/35857_1 /TAXON_ID=693140 ORGANISM="Tiarina fusus, Strain LIS" /NCGR_SAMPLE_ID=MMETSP0472 /ASSEMBLY_ACC=CAM_ASM_000603 /LENGTH=175 /DNA_ID=CAMNT_0004766285 /DNA_START=117 /DNA_END=640 /DNA_ORIENTATION=+